MSLVRTLSLCTIALLAYASAEAQNTYLTFLHNSADVGLKTIDLYVTQSGVTQKIEDIAFQQTENFQSTAIFGNLSLNLKVAPGSSVGPGEAVASYDFTPKNDSGYMVVLNGVRTPGEYAPNPDGKPTAIAMTSFFTVFEITDHSKTGFYVVHGATDLEGFDMFFRGVTAPIATNLSYGMRNANPTSAVRNTVTVDLTKAGDKTKVLASFSLNIPALSSEVAVLVVSGFKTPADNSGSTDSLAILAITANGSVLKLPLILGSQKSHVQFINNLPEVRFLTADVWIQTDALPAPVKQVDNLQFRGATAFLDLPSSTPLVVGVALSNSTAMRDTIFFTNVAGLKPDRNYTFILTGVDAAGYAANPEGIDSIAHVEVLEDALQAPNLLGELSVRAGNFSTDAQPLTMYGQTQYIAGASYLDYAPQYVPAVPRLDTIWVRDDSTGSLIKGYVCTPCEQSRALLVLASGFRKPAGNKDGPAFKLIFVQADGTVISNAQEVDSTTTDVTDFAVEGTVAVRAYPNPSNGDVSIAWGGFANGAGATVKVFDVQGNLILSAPVEPGVQNARLNTVSMTSGLHFARILGADGSLIGSTSFDIVR